MLPWFPGDFMRSTRGWSVTARGVYRELLDAQWDNGFLPADLTELRELIHATTDEWAQGWVKCGPKFPVMQGVRINKRLESHREKALQLTLKRQKGAEITNLRRLAQRRAERSAQRTHPSPSPSPSPIRSVSVPSNAEAPVFNLSSESNGSGAAEQPVVVPEFEAFRRIFPSRTGSQRWEDARRFATNLVKRREYSWQQILDAAQRYRDKCDRECITGLSIVMQPATFVGREHKENIANAWQSDPSKGDRKVAEGISESQKWLEQRRAQRAGH